MTDSFAEKFSYRRLIKFVYPSIIMMVFTSVYGVIDGIFVSNFAGDSAFAAVNLIMPVLMAFAALGFMVGTGGSALVSKILGEGDDKKANRTFSLLFFVTIVLGLIATLIGELAMPALARLMIRADSSGGNEQLYGECVLYGRINVAGMTAFMLQNFFQSFFPVAKKPKLGLAFIVSAGLTNAALDAVLIAGFKLGLTGAALATVLGQVVGGVAPIFYFLFVRGGILKLGKPELAVRPVLRTFLNGSSEMMTNLSLSLVNIIYNYQLMRLAGKGGVEAYGVLMYVGFIFCSVFIGYSIGVAPIIGFNYGAENRAELKNVLKKSLIIISVFSAIMFTLAMSLSYPLSYIFLNKDREILDMTVHAFRIFSFTFLIMGFSIFGSAFFTALNSGLISAVISFLRTLLFQVICVLVLPILFGLDGVWAANVAAEALAIIVTTTLIIVMRKKYGY